MYLYKINTKLILIEFLSLDIHFDLLQLRAFYIYLAFALSYPALINANDIETPTFNRSCGTRGGKAFSRNDTRSPLCGFARNEHNSSGVAELNDLSPAIAR